MALPNKSELHQLIAEAEAAQGPDFYADAEALEIALAQHNASHTDLGIKLLTIIGGLLASLFLTGFLFLLEIFHSPGTMLVLGALFIIGALFLSRQSGSILLDTTAVCAYLIGLVLFGMGAGEQLHLKENVLLLMLPVALATVLISDKPVFVFLGTLLFTGSLAGLMLIHKQYVLLHGLIAFSAIGLTWVSLQEPWLISRHPRLNLAFGPLRMGLLVTLLCLLLVLAHPQLVEFYPPYAWLSTVVLVACLGVVVFKVYDLFSVTDLAYRLLIPVALGLIFLPTLYMPSIAGAMLVLVVSFYTGHRAGIGLSAIALIYFVILFYYDLQLTLLTKSIILMLSGALFLGAYWLLHQKLKQHAEDI